MSSNSHQSRIQAANRATTARSRLALAPVPLSNPYYQPMAALLLKEFPAFLPRPVIWEVDITTIQEYFPHLAGVTAREMRERLPYMGTHLLNCIAGVSAEFPDLGPQGHSALPKDIKISVDETAAEDCPTHMLAVYSKSSRRGVPRQLQLYPIHQLVLALNCSSLPILPPHQPYITHNNTSILPVVSIPIPHPDVFQAMHHYLYMKDAEVLLAYFLSGIDTFTPTQVSRRGATIVAVWDNAMFLGIVDHQLYEVIEEAFRVVMDVLKQISLGPGIVGRA